MACAIRNYNEPDNRNNNVGEWNWMDGLVEYWSPGMRIPYSNNP
jgi:hypothetical protein